MTKISQLLNVLKQGHTVTRATAMASLKIANLPATISALRNRGHKIVATTGPDGSTAGDNYTRWTLIQRKRPAKPTKPTKPTKKGGTYGRGS